MHRYGKGRKMILIHKNFIGGNIVVKEAEGNTFVLENELRDTVGDWFYFAFCVEGAEGERVTFRMQKSRLGPWGPAVSHDLENWHWLGECDGDSFTYRFGTDEHRVYFAHHMLYPMHRMLDVASAHGYQTIAHATSLAGHKVPALTIGEGEKTILLTSRHHACESTGTYVLEGVLKVLAKGLPEGYRVYCVPFVDYDGVYRGDQGKNRTPHDHNRDYDEGTDALYPEVRAIREYRDKNECTFAFDFHSPWHRGGRNDTIFIVRNLDEKMTRFDAFSSLLCSHITGDAMAYHTENDIMPGVEWNKGSKNFARTQNLKENCHLAFTLENTYFGTEENKVSTERLIALGECFGRALIAYIHDKM